MYEMWKQYIMYEFSYLQWICVYAHMIYVIPYMICSTWIFGSDITIENLRYFHVLTM